MESEFLGVVGVDEGEVIELVVLSFLVGVLVIAVEQLIVGLVLLQEGIIDSLFLV